MKAIIIFLLAIAPGVIALPIAEAAGLNTAFSEVLLENLETGKVYSTKETAGLPLSVVNSGRDPVDLKIEVLLAAPEELKAGYEPIPDISWITVEQTEFTAIPAGGTATTDVIISIPDKDEYRGKSYQVFIWSHTTGTMVGVGLKSKLLLKIRGE